MIIIILTHRHKGSIIEPITHSADILVVEQPQSRETPDQSQHSHGTQQQSAKQEGVYEVCALCVPYMGQLRNTYCTAYQC